MAQRREMEQMRAALQRLPVPKDRSFDDLLARIAAAERADPRHSHYA